VQEPIPQDSLSLPSVVRAAFKHLMHWFTLGVIGVSVGSVPLE
jgi:hypothetical protein